MRFECLTNFGKMTSAHVNNNRERKKQNFAWEYCMLIVIVLEFVLNSLLRLIAIKLNLQNEIEMRPTWVDLVW